MNCLDDGLLFLVLCLSVCLTVSVSFPFLFVFFAQVAVGLCDLVGGSLV